VATHDRSVVLDLHGVGEGDELLVDGRKGGSRRVLELEGLPQAERLAVDQEDLVVVLIGDPEVIGDGEQPFPYEIAHTGEAIAGGGGGGNAPESGDRTLHTTPTNLVTFG
jgi:hypothetical protein